MGSVSKTLVKRLAALERGLGVGGDPELLARLDRAEARLAMMKKADEAAAREEDEEGSQS